MPSSDGYKNLIPITELAEDVQRAMRLKGAEKCNAVKREKKLFKDVCKVILENKQEKSLNELAKSLDSADVSIKEKIEIFKLLADYSGQKPSEKQEILSSNLQININRQAVNEQKNI